MSARRSSGVHLARGGSTCRLPAMTASSCPRSSFSRLSVCQSPPFSVACQKHCGVKWACTSMLRIGPSRTCYPSFVPVRVAAIGVSHWHSLYDSAYLRHLSEVPDMQLVGLHDSSAAIAAKRAAVLGDPPVFTDYRRMMTETRPDFVIALGRHSTMAETALYLLDQGHPFLMEKPMGVNAEEVRRVADRAAAKNAFVAVPLIQRYQPFTARARSLLADGRFGPMSHIYYRLNRPTSARYVAWDATWMLDPQDAGGGCLRNLGPHGLDLFLSDRRGGGSHRGSAQLAGPRAAGGGLRVGPGAIRQGCSWNDRGRQHVSPSRHGRRMEDRLARRDVDPPGRRASPDDGGRGRGHGGRARGTARADGPARCAGLLAPRGATSGQRPRLPARGAPHRPGVCARPSARRFTCLSDVRVG